MAPKTNKTTKNMQKHLRTISEDEEGVNPLIALEKKRTRLSEERSKFLQRLMELEGGDKEHLLKKEVRSLEKDVEGIKREIARMEGRGGVEESANGEVGEEELTDTDTERELRALKEEIEKFKAERK